MFPEPLKATPYPEPVFHDPAISIISARKGIEVGGGGGGGEALVIDVPPLGLPPYLTAGAPPAQRNRGRTHAVRESDECIVMPQFIRCS